MKNADMPAMPEIVRSDENRDEEGTFYHQSHGGLTKREHFAAMAMQGMLASYKELYEACQDGERPVKYICEASVNFASALLAELERTK